GSAPKFLIFYWVAGLESQMILTQPSSMSASPGLTFNIPCQMNSGYSINSERARWYQQKPGGAPRFLYHYYTSTDQGRGTGVPERFSVSPDASQNLWNLVINGVQVEDDAVYYCSSWDYKLTGHTVIDFNEELRQKPFACHAKSGSRR
uniref:Ig-like domain-containing protein n=1 Tax=Pseudonaja textilis TaxID=8673 RepID=A0A670ZQD5_PSETE